MSTAALHTKDPSQGQRNRNPVPLLVVLFLILLTGLGVGGYFLWTGILQPMLTKSATTTSVPATTTTKPAETKPMENKQDETKATPAPTPTPNTGTAPTLLGKHDVIKGDTLWWISDKWYQEPRYWPLIFRINKDEVKDPDLLHPGQKLDIPALMGAKDNLAAEDKANLGQGYLDAYRVYKEKGKADAESYRLQGESLTK